MADLIERLRETGELHARVAMSGGCYTPSELRAFADEAKEAAAALAKSEEARETAEWGLGHEIRIKCDAIASFRAAEASLSQALARIEELEKADGWQFRDHLRRQREWSERTFGPGPRTKGVIDHIRKELGEIEADPTDILEWIDVTILALDGAWRAGFSPDQIIAALIAKQTRNEGRTWPDWRTSSPDHAIEHVRPATPIDGGKG